jgi:hypothetical protein
LLASGNALIGENTAGAHLHAQTLDRSIWDPDSDPALSGIVRSSRYIDCEKWLASTVLQGLNLPRWPTKIWKMSVSP